MTVVEKRHCCGENNRWCHLCGKNLKVHGYQTWWTPVRWKEPSG